ncbi:unnamed protein product [Urochloa humidicola]
MSLTSHVVVLHTEAFSLLIPVPARASMNFDRHGVLTKLGFVTLTGNSALAIYRSRDDPRSVAFVAGAYGAISLLFHFLRRFERGEGDRGRTKAAVWLLTTLLTAMFASRVAPLMPPAVAVLVWMMAAGTAGAGFWAFFLHQ